MNFKRVIFIFFIINIVVLSSLLIYNKSLNKKYISLSKKSDDLSLDEEIGHKKFEENKRDIKEDEKYKDRSKKQIGNEIEGTPDNSGVYLNKEKEIVLLNPKEVTFRKLTEDKDIDYNHYHDLTSGIVGLYNYDSLEEFEDNINKYFEKQLLYVYQPDYFDMDGNIIDEDKLDDNLRLEKKNIKNKIVNIRTFIFTDIENFYNTITYLDMGKNEIRYLEGRWKVFTSGRFGLREPLVYGTVSSVKNSRN